MHAVLNLHAYRLYFMYSCDVRKCGIGLRNLQSLYVLPKRYLNDIGADPLHSHKACYLRKTPAWVPCAYPGDYSEQVQLWFKRALQSTVVLVWAGNYRIAISVWCACPRGDLRVPFAGNWLYVRAGCTANPYTPSKGRTQIPWAVYFTLQVGCTNTETPQMQGCTIHALTSQTTDVHTSAQEGAVFLYPFLPAKKNKQESKAWDLSDFTSMVMLL